MMQFQTNRLEVRPMSIEDKEAILDLLTDEIVGRTYMIPEYRSREEAEPLALRLIELSHAQDRYVAGVYLKATFIGLMNETEVKDDQIEMGYALLPAYHNQGFATEAFSGAIRYLYSHGFETVLAGAFSENAASVRVMEKCGLERCSHADEIEYRGKVHTCVNFAITRKGNV